MTINRYTMGEAKLLYANDKEIVPAHEYDALAAELAEQVDANTELVRRDVQSCNGLNVANRRIRELEAALRKKGHAPNCDLDPCDCGLAAVLTPSETSAERCKHGVWAADRCEQCVKETEAKGG